MAEGVSDSAQAAAAAGRQVGRLIRTARAMQPIYQAAAANLEGARHAGRAAGELPRPAEKPRALAAR